MKLKKDDKNLKEEWLRVEELLEHELNCDAGDHTTCLESGFALIAKSLSRICRCPEHAQDEIKVRRMKNLTAGGKHELNYDGV
jgi:hypothetical protein